MATVPKWVSVKLERGMWPDIAPRKAKGFFRTGNWARWRPQLEPIGGWESGLAASSNTYLGKARKIIEYADNNGYPVTFIGTHSTFWDVFDGEMYHISPVEAYVALTAAITTTAASSTFTVTKTAHGYVAGMYIRFPTGPTVDGVILTARMYAIATVTTDSFTFNAGGNAAAGGAGLGGTNLDMDVFLRPGLEYGLAGSGYGTSYYDVGTYGGNATAQYRARIVTGGAIGELLVVNPNGGAIYEFGPAFSTTELAERSTNGDLTTAQGWTIGTSWAFHVTTQSMDASAVTAANTVNLSQSITVPSGRWVRIRYTVTSYSAGTLTLKIGSTALTPYGAAGSGITANGRYTYEVWNTTSTAQTLSWTCANFTGNVSQLTVKVSDILCKRTQAPANSNGIVITPQGHVVAYGCTDATTSVVDPMLVRSSNINDTTTWTTAYTNHARSFYLREGNIILQGLNGADGQIYFLTNRGLWEAQYVGLSEVFTFTRRAGNCGAHGTRSATYDGTRLIWASNKKEFKSWNGARLETVFCPGQDTVFGNIAASQQDLCEFHTHTHSEAWFIYPGASEVTDISSEVSRYAFVSFEDESAVYWSFGTNGRTAWADGVGGMGYPLAAQSGTLYLHEKGDSAEGAASLGWSARATGIEIGDGNTTGEISGFMPDRTQQAGPFTVRFYGYIARTDDGAPADNDSGALSVTASTTYVLPAPANFVEGREIDIEFAGNYYVKIGDPRYLLADTENQF